MKAILVAGGHGSRLYPFTRYTHKTLLPLHRRPVIDYALATNSLDKLHNMWVPDCPVRTSTM